VVHAAIQAHARGVKRLPFGANIADASLRGTMRAPDAAVMHISAGWHLTCLHIAQTETTRRGVIVDRTQKNESTGARKQR